MVIKKIRKIYRVREISGKPIVIEFRKKDGSVVRLRATRIVRKPQKVVFKRVKKVYKK